MAFPKHKNPSDDKATAPYNFVPLPDKVETVNDIPDHNRYRSDRCTGRIEVELTTASPLYIRGGLSPELFAEIGKKSSPQHQRQMAQFFHTHDENNPVIPGSSLRGMLRAMVEIVTYGKVQPVSDKPLVYRAVGDRTSFGDFYRMQVLGPNKSASAMHYDYPLKNVKGGYLAKGRDGNWAIQPAHEFFGESFVHIDYADADPIVGGHHGRQKVHNVFVEPAARIKSNRGKRGNRTLSLDLAITTAISKTQDSPTMKAAKLIESGQMGKPGIKHGKHMHCAIYEPHPTKPLLPITQKMWEIYQEDRDQNRGIKTRKLTRTGDPLFYLVDDQGKLVFFGPTMMFRLPYQLSPYAFGPKILQDEIDKIDEKQGGHRDFAEAMFGYVQNDKQSKNGLYSRAGRIFVENAYLAQQTNDIWLHNEPIIPKILSSPKPTSFQLYLTQKFPNDKKSLYHYGTSPEKTVIRGHKLYWHKGEEPVIENDSPQAGATQLTKIKPIKPGVAFNFTIHFENLSELELGALWWVLRLGADPNYRLKLGMGKPLGMGAVETKPTLILTDRKTRYRSLFEGNQWQTGKINDDNTVADKAADDFEAYIRNNHRDAFGSEGRIAQLISLLSFPGPAPSQTSYMNDLKAFSRDRKVLPLPTSIHRSNFRERNRNPTRQSPLPPKKSRPLPPIPIEGQIFTGTVIEKNEATRVLTITHPSFPKEVLQAIMKFENTGGVDYGINTSARCQVVKKYQKNNLWVLECKRPPKKQKKKRR